MADRELTEDELRGRAKQFALIVKQRPEFVIEALNECLKDCPLGVCGYWREIRIGERRPSATVT